MRDTTDIKTRFFSVFKFGTRFSRRFYPVAAGANWRASESTGGDGKTDRRVEIIAVPEENRS